MEFATPKVKRLRDEIDC